MTFGNYTFDILETLGLHWIFGDNHGEWHLRSGRNALYDVY